jgi:hypothetical protein
MARTLYDLLDPRNRTTDVAVTPSRQDFFSWGRSPSKPRDKNQAKKTPDFRHQQGKNKLAFLSFASRAC